MALLDSELYNKVIVEGKKAVQALQHNELDAFEDFAEKGWELFPAPKENWNQAYNYAKMIFNGFFKNNNFEKSKIWLDRMIENNNNLHLYDYEIDHFIAKYLFETGDCNGAYNTWDKIVKIKSVSYRYFENEAPKYREFYKKEHEKQLK